MSVSLRMRSSTGSISSLPEAKTHIRIKHGARLVAGSMCNNWLRTDGVVAAGEVVCRVLLARDHLLGVVELAVHARANLVNHCRLKVDEDSARHVTSTSGLTAQFIDNNKNNNYYYLVHC